MYRFTSAVAALLVSLGIAPALRAGNIIINGGFETPTVADGTYITLGAGSNALGPWVIGLTSVDLIGVNGGAIIGPVYEGRQYIDLDGTPGPGELTQSFATTPGRTYELSFAYADNYATGSVHSAAVSVFDSSGYLLGPMTISHDTSVAGDLHWTVFTGGFTADGLTASLDFKSLDGFSFGGILLDGVSITSVPEPGGLLLIGIGLSGSLISFRRRRPHAKRRGAGSE